MTHKEAIEILRHYNDIGYGIVIEGDNTKDIKEALDLAIEALKTEARVFEILNK